MTSHLDGSALPAQPAEGESARRLLVLVADADSEDPEFPRRIWSLARESPASVLLVGLYPEKAEQARVRRQLVTLAAAVRDGQIPVEIEVRRGRDWVGTIGALGRPGDEVVVKLHPGTSRRSDPAGQVLSAAVPIPIRVVPSPYLAERAVPWRTIVAWGGNLAILAAFLWLQFQVGRMPILSGRISFLLLSVLVEIGALSVWNSLIG